MSAGAARKMKMEDEEMVAAVGLCEDMLLISWSSLHVPILS
jgi:hypothetical protein